MDKMRIDTLEVAGINIAIMSMRNPKASWYKSDSYYDDLTGDFIIGEKDLNLAQNLTRAGREHAKYLRMIQVWSNVHMPREWWSEADTYKFGVKNSTSTMFRLMQDPLPLTTNDFVYCWEDKDHLILDIEYLNGLKKEWRKCQEEKDKDGMDRLRVRAKRLLPEGYIQMRTWNTNYAELMNMYHQRKNHGMKEEWEDVFRTWCRSLPYFEELCGQATQKAL